MALKQIDIGHVQLNPFDRIGREWMLVTAGTSPQDCNTMTAAWGGLGMMWGLDAATIYLRPQRYTKEFVERENRFTLSFFGEGNKRDALMLLGSKSGRDVPDKIEQAGITPVALQGSVAFEEADLVFCCRSLYSCELPPENFIDKSLDGRWYPDRDYHFMYIAEVESAWVQA